MKNISPLGVLFAIVVIGITIEAVERQSKGAAYALVLLVLLGIVTFNAGAFTAQINGIIGALGRVQYSSVGHRTRIKRG